LNQSSISVERNEENTIRIEEEVEDRKQPFMTLRDNRSGGNLSQNNMYSELGALDNIMVDET